MKRLISLILMFCLFLSGCSVSGERIKEPVTFYYVSEDYQRDMDQVIGSEVREAALHRNDLSYLLALYSMGPSKEELKSPLPRNTQIVPVERTDNGITLSLSDNTLTMTDADLTLASACIALTCMDLIRVQQVTVVCGDRSITIQQDNLQLNHVMVQTPLEEEK